MNISGVLLHAYPQNLDSVFGDLATMPGVEVHANNDFGKIVLTIEQADDGAMSDTLLQLQNLPGVLNASMIYHQFEDLSND